MNFPWESSSKSLRFNLDGKFPLEFPRDCQIRLFFLEFDHAQRLTPSYHEYLEISYIYAGIGRFTINNVCYTVQPGDLIVVGDHEFHLMVANKHEAVKTISLHFLPELIYTPGQNSQDFEYIKPFYMRGKDFTHIIPSSSLPDNLVLARLTQIQDEIYRGESLYPLAVRTYVRDILFEVSRFYQQEDIAPNKASRRASDYERLRAVFDYISNCYSQEITLSQAASLANMSPTSFCRYFKSITGTVFSDYVLRYRIDRAMDLLISTNLAVSQVATQVGFNTHSYFARAFKAITGATPTETRHPNH